MRQVFEHPNFHQVGHFQSILESHSIPSVIRNENTSSIVGEIPFVSAYPELWVTNDEDFERAIALLREYRDSAPPEVAGADWICPQCGEEVPGNFSSCWKCDRLREQTPPPTV